MCSYLHFTSSEKDGQAWRVKPKNYTSFWANNTHRVDSLTISGTKPMPVRFQVHGKEGPGVAVREHGEGNDVLTRYRFEQHPNEMLDIITRYAPPSSIVCDTTAGGLVTAYASLRLGHPCIVVDAQVEGDMLDNAWERLEQAYQFLKEDGLLPEAGAPPREPQFWELEGKTWMHRVQYYQKQRGLRADRASATKKIRQDSAELLAQIVSASVVVCVSVCLCVCVSDSVCLCLCVCVPV